MKMSSNVVRAANDQIFLEVLPEVETVEGLSFGRALATKLDVEFYKGKILNVGAKVPKNYEPGMLAVFSQFAGKTPPTQDIYTKIVFYQNLVAFLKEEDMKIENIIPTQNRVVVEVNRDNDYDANGVLLAGSDPREGEVLGGVIKTYGPDADPALQALFPVGTKIYFDPYVGNPLNEQIRVLFDHDILFAEENL